MRWDTFGRHGAAIKWKLVVFRPNPGIHESEQSVPKPLPKEGHASTEDPFTHRVLCVDGACIGVVGKDGRCECGKTHPDHKRSSDYETSDKEQEE